MIERIQKLLSPSSSIYQATNAKEASVLLPLCLVNGTLSLIFTVRSSALSRNSGQVSFPGGMKDAQDEDYKATAQRETMEEIGISNMLILGRLAPVYDRTLTIRVHPFVGYMDIPLVPRELKCNPAEVSRIFTVAVDDLLSNRHLAIQNFEDPFKISIPSWDIKVDDNGIGSVANHGDVKIWGLTAYITDQFLRILPKALKL
jgi:nudix motif 8